MVLTVAVCALVLVAAVVYAIERHGNRQAARAPRSVPGEEMRHPCAASYLRESIATSLVHEPNHLGYFGRRR